MYCAHWSNNKNKNNPMGKLKEFDFAQFRAEQARKKEESKATVEKVYESTLLKQRTMLAKTEAELYTAKFNLAQVKYLIELLLRRRTLLQGNYEEKELRLKANTIATDRLVTELAQILQVEDPSEKMDADAEEEFA